MNINEIYDNKKKSFLFHDSNEFQLLRKKLIEEFNLSPKNIRNNESLKHLDPNVLKFNYDYDVNRNDIEYNNTKNANNSVIISAKVAIQIGKPSSLFSFAFLGIFILLISFLMLGEYRNSTCL